MEGIRWIRDRIIVRQVLSSARFRCEVDPDHTTFITEASGDPYLEGHHLIPLSRQDRFPHSLDVYANLIGPVGTGAPHLS